MIVLISPAKTMKKRSGYRSSDCIANVSQANQLNYGKSEISCEYPLFVEQSQQILEVMKQLSSSDIQKMMKVNEKIATETQNNYQTLLLDDQGMPALYTYDGIQYKAMETQHFSKEEMAFANEHIRILSGFYGILKPNTSIYPYRLEMQLKVPVGDKKNLYEHWKEPLANHLLGREEQRKLKTKEPKIYINLASKEYSKAVEEDLTQTDRFITCTFKVVKNGVPKVESTASKQARGAMVQAIVKNRWTTPDQLKQFDWNGYQFDEDSSSSSEFVFIKA